MSSSLLASACYNPTVGRFIQEDSYRGDRLNLYAYVANNPIKYIDPSGHAAMASVDGGGGSTKCNNASQTSLYNSFVNGFKGLFIDQVSSIKDSLESFYRDPVGTYTIYMTDPNNYVHPVIKLNISNVQNAASGFQVIASGDINKISERLGRNVAEAVEAVVLSAILDGVARLGTRVIGKAAQAADDAVGGISNSTRLTKSQIDDLVEKIGGADKLTLFAGVAPSFFGPGGKGKEQKSRQGNRRLYGIFYFLAVQMIQVSIKVTQRNAVFLEFFKRKQTEEKTKPQALVSVLRRLVNIICGMLKDKTEYKAPVVSNKEAI